MRINNRNFRKSSVRLNISYFQCFNLIFYSFKMPNDCVCAALRSPATCLLLPEFQPRQCISLHLSLSPSPLPFPSHPQRRQRMATAAACIPTQNPDSYPKTGKVCAAQIPAIPLVSHRFTFCTPPRCCNYWLGLNNLKECNSI